MRMFNIKKLSWKIAIIVVVAVLVVGGAVSFYFEMRVTGLIDLRSNLNIDYQAAQAAAVCNDVFSDAYYRVGGIRNLAESCFSVDEYKNDAETYFANQFDPLMSSFVYNTVRNNDNIFAAYFAVQPDLAGYPLVNEIFYERDGNSITRGEPQTYEEYKQANSEDMEWFYGAYNSGKPYWTQVYEFDGVDMVSYIEPVTMGGAVIAVVGVDIAINEIIEVVKGIKIYETGFAILEDNQGALIESNSVISGFTSNDRNKLAGSANTAQGEVFEVELNGVRYVATRKSLLNDYNVYILATRTELNAEKVKSIMTFVIIFPTVLLIVVIVSIFIGKSFSKPLIALSAFMTKASTTGDLSMSQVDIEVVGKYTQYNDEIGQAIKSCAGFINRITAISEELETIATGDLTTELAPLSARDVMGNSLQSMSRRLSEMFGEITRSAMHVSAGSRQVAGGAQSLAQGATEQAASIEELSSSITDIAEKTKANAGMAMKAVKLADTIKESAEKGSGHMSEMIAAVNKINEASNSISKVNKVIDDIAFQTNILALNAAVEAARAGQHGKGFAVVAEEVRNLAAKSAEAAKETGGLIENSIEKANLGVRIAGETADSLTKIVSGIGESNQLVGEIAKLSEEQSRGIEQVNVGIDQVAQVVQQNSATAEESAASSEEMSSQSAVLQELIAQFRLKDDGSAPRRLPPPDVSRLY